MSEHEDTQLLELYVTSNAGEDAAVKAVLDDNGVPYVEHMLDMNRLGIAPAIDGYCQILVLEEHAKRAHKVLMAALDGKDIPPPSKKHQSLPGDSSIKPAGGHTDVGQKAPRHRNR